MNEWIGLDEHLLHNDEERQTKHVEYQNKVAQKTDSQADSQWAIASQTKMPAAHVQVNTEIL